MTRRLAREQAFALIFEFAFQDEPVEQIVENAREGRNLEGDAYALRLACETKAQLQEIDGWLQKYSTKWKLGRLPKVTLAILRLSVCELMSFGDIPVSVTINEAVELAKRFGTEEDASYVNGVLGALVKELAPCKDEEA